MTRIRLRQPLIPVIVAFLLGLQVMEPSRVWTILLVGFAGTFIIAYIWTRALGREMHLRRETRLSWIQVGGQIEERLTLSNAHSFPAAWVEFLDQSTLPGFDASKYTSIGSGSFEQWNVSAICSQRGSYYLGGALIRTGDPFGIFEVNIPASQRTSILVLPQITTLPEMLIAPSGIHGESQPRRNALYTTIHASSVREYLYHDSMRMIHWPTTARMQKPFVRLMESAPEGNWWILLDLNHGHLPGEGWDSIEEQSVSLAASLADLGLRERKSVGMIANGEDLTWIAPQKGAGQRWEILRALATTKPGSRSLTSLLDRMGSSLGKHHSLIIVTASQELGWLKSVSTLGKRGIVPTVFLLDLAQYGETSAETAASTLEQHGIRCHVIPRGMIQPPSAASSALGKGSWKTTHTGEFIPMQFPSGQVK